MVLITLLQNTSAVSWTDAIADRETELYKRHDTSVALVLYASIAKDLGP